MKNADEKPHFRFQISQKSTVWILNSLERVLLTDPDPRASRSGSLCRCCSRPQNRRSTWRPNLWGKRAKLCQTDNFCIWLDLGRPKPEFFWIAELFSEIVPKWPKNMQKKFCKNSPPKKSKTSHNADLLETCLRSKLLLNSRNFWVAQYIWRDHRI